MTSPENKRGFDPDIEQGDQDIQEFKKYFPDAEFQEITFDAVPDDVKEVFEFKSATFTNTEDYKKGNFTKVHLLTHADGTRTYIAMQTKTYATNKETEELSYFVDTEGEDVTGYGELRYAISKNTEYFKHKPFVGSTVTYPKHLRKGLGSRRLEAMNAFAQMEYHTPLYSDTLISESARGVWEKLVANNKAEKFKEGKHYRYVFRTIKK